MLATVSWDPEGWDSLTDVIQSVWSQPGDHIVMLPEYDVTNGWYGNGWQANEIMWEWAGDLNAGLHDRQCTTLTIQGAGRDVTYLGSSSATGKGSIVQNGWNRVNAVNMVGITFKDLSIANLSNTSMFGVLNNGASVAHDITFENCNVYLGPGVIQGRTCTVGGDAGTFHFVNSTLAITKDAIAAQYHYAAGMPDQEWMLFDADSRIARYSGGTFSASAPGAYAIGSYSTSLVNVGDLYWYADGPDYGDPAQPRLPDGGLGRTNTQYAALNEGTYFVTSLLGTGASGWSDGVPTAQVAAPAIGTTGTLSGASTTYGTASGTSTITVSGSGLTANITATAPSGFEVSSNGSSFSSTATFTQSGGTASGTLYVRLAATTAAGTYSGNVTLSSSGATSVNAAMPSSSVGQKAIAITGVTAASRFYDGTTSASLNNASAALSGVVSGDTVTLSVVSAVGTFADKNAGTGKTVTTTGYSISGASSGNYSLIQPAPTATIAPKALTVRADHQSKVAGAANPTLTATLMGFVPGETAATAVSGAASLSTTATTESPTGSYPITVATGTLAATNGNYAFPTFVDGTLTVTSAPVKVTGLYVKGGTWNSTYLGLSSFTTLGTAKLGWRLRDGASQLSTSGGASNAPQVTWSNVNRVLVRFDQAVALPAADALQLVSGATGQTVSSSAASFVTGTDVAGTVVQFTVPTLQTGRYVASLASTAIRDAAQTTYLDGEWTDSSSTFASGSGDGTVGGIFNFSFNVLVGDTTGNGLLNLQDRTAVTQQLYKTMTASNFRANVDGSTGINPSDYSPVISNLYKALGSPLTPVAAASATIASPTSANLTSSGARLGGTVTGGGEPVLERGVVILAGESGTPAVDDPAAIALQAAAGTGAFTVDVSGLLPSQTYRFRAYVRTSQGIVYTSVGTFTTGAG